MTELSVELKVLRRIRAFEKKNEKVWFTKLLKSFDGDITRSELSKAEDKMQDLGMIRKKYEQAEGKWTSCYSVESEVRSFADSLPKENPK